MTDVRQPAPPAPPIPLTGPPFPRAEYEARWAAVAGRMEELGVDAMAVTAPTHLRYLCGYDGSGGYFAPFPLVVAPGAEPLMVCRKYDEDAVRAQSVLTQVATYLGHADFVLAWADALHALRLDRGRVGLELGAWGLAPADVAGLRRVLPELTVVDATRLVGSVWAAKSPAEIEVMRQAMACALDAVGAFRAGLRPGVTETELALEIDRAVLAAGGERQGFTLLFGARSALPHGSPAPHPLADGDVAFTELAGWRHGYAAALVRTAVLGRNPAAEALLSVAEEALVAAIGEIRPGRTTGDVDAACRAVVERAGRAGAFRHRTGYGIGIGWYERGNISLEPGGGDVLLPGMTFHLPVILFEQGRLGVGCSETVLVTEVGAEPLSAAERPGRL